MKSYLQICTRICALLFLTREFASDNYSDDSSERLWLVISFINSTESCVIGYNAALYKCVLSLAQRQPANAELNLAADDMTHVRFNHAGVILLNIKNINQ